MGAEGRAAASGAPSRSGRRPRHSPWWRSPNCRSRSPTTRWRASRWRGRNRRTPRRRWPPCALTNGDRAGGERVGADGDGLAPVDASPCPSRSIRIASPANWCRWRSRRRRSLARCSPWRARWSPWPGPRDPCVGLEIGAEAADRAKLGVDRAEGTADVTVDRALDGVARRGELAAGVEAAPPPKAAATRWLAVRSWLPLTASALPGASVPAATLTICARCRRSRPRPCWRRWRPNPRPSPPN